MASDSTNRGSGRRTRIGKYEVIKHLATGGMGAVYKALDVDLNRPVALKILSAELAVKPGVLDRFRREARAAAKLRHENIVAVYEVGECNGTYFMALEFVEGTDLFDYISRQGKLAPPEARQLIIQAARALEHAHKAGIVHRDIKPSNFLLTEKDGQLIVKLTDLGLAREVRDEEFRLTREGSTVGTVDYMAPEQARDSGAADTRSDIYSLGCTFYHMLAGNCPFPTGSIAERIFMHIQTEPPDVRTLNPDVPANLVLILRRMLAKDPAERYQTPRELLLHLENPGKVLETAASGLSLLEPGNGPAEAPAAPRKTPVKAAANGPTAHREVEAEDENRSAPRKRRPRDDDDDDEHPKKKKKKSSRSSLPSWWPFAAAGAGVALIGLILLLLGVFSPRGEDDPKNKKPPIDIVNKPKNNGGENPPKKIEDGPKVWGPEDRERALLYKPTAALERAKLIPEFFGPFAEFPKAAPGAVVYKVSRLADPGPTSFRSLADALAKAPPDKQVVIEIHDNGPLFEASLPSLAKRNVVVRAGPGYRPLIAWDLEAGRRTATDGAAAKGNRAFVTLNPGSLVLEDLDVVVKWDEPRAEEPLTLFDVRAGNFQARGCTFSVAGRHGREVQLVRLGGQPAPAKDSAGPRCRLSRCYARGADFTIVAVDQCSAEVLLDNCLFAGGDTPLVRVAGKPDNNVTLRVVRSTLVAGKVLLDVLPSEGKGAGPKVKWLGWDDLLARSDPQTDGDMVNLADGVVPEALEWRTVNCLYAGWKKLLAAGTQSIAAGALDQWRKRWGHAEGDRELAETWPRKHFAEPEEVPAQAFVADETPACFAATSGPGALGASPGLLPAAPPSWLMRSFERYTLPPIALSDSIAPPAIPTGSDGFYHGERLDLTSVDLGQHLRAQLQKLKPGPKIVLHLSGSGDRETSPIQLKGVKHLVLYFEPARDVLAPPLVLIPHATKGTGKGGLFEIDDGTLEVIGGRVRLQNSKFAPMTVYLFKVKDGELLLDRCTLQGPFHLGPDHFQGLIHFQGQNATEAGPRLAIHQSILVSGKNLITVKGSAARVRCKQSLLVAYDDLLRIEPVAARGFAMTFLLDNNTFAFRKTLLALRPAPDLPAVFEPVVIQANGNLFLDPFAGDGNESALLRTEAPTLAQGLLLWQGKGNGFDHLRLHAYATPPDRGSLEKQSFQDWTKLWGSHGDVFPLLVDLPNSPKHTLNPTPQTRTVALDVLALPMTVRPHPQMNVLPGANLQRLGFAVPKKKG